MNDGLKWWREGLTSSFASMYFFLISALDRQEKTKEVVATFLTCPLGPQPELRGLELWNNER